MSNVKHNLHSETEAHQAPSEQPHQASSAGPIVMEASKSQTYILAVVALMACISGGLLYQLVQQIPRDVQELKLDLKEEVTIRTERETAMKDRISTLERQSEIALARLRAVEDATLQLSGAFESMAERYEDVKYIRKRWEEYNNSDDKVGIYGK